MYLGIYIEETKVTIHYLNSNKFKRVILYDELKREKEKYLTSYFTYLIVAFSIATSLPSVAVPTFPALELEVLEHPTNATINKTIPNNNAKFCLFILFLLILFNSMLNISYNL